MQSAEQSPPRSIWNLPHLNIFAELSRTERSALISLQPIYEYLSRDGDWANGEYIVIAEWPVQFLIPATALEVEALTRAVRVEVEGTPTWVMTAEDLVAIALQAGRRKDHNRILQFLELKTADQNKLQQILERHALVLKWNRFEVRYLRGRH